MAYIMRRVYVADGVPQAEFIAALLEASGIHAALSGEGAGRALGLTVGPLAEVEIYVREDQQAEAEALLRQFQSGADTKA